MMRGDSIDINTPFEKKTLYYAPSENNNLLILKVDNAGEAIWLKQGSGFATHALVSNDVSYIVGPLLSVSLAGDCYLDLPFQGNPNQDSVTLGNKTRVNPFPWLTFKFKGDGTIDTIFDLYPFAELSITRVVVDEFHNATYTGSIFPAQYDSFTKFIFLGDDSIQISKLRGSQILIYRMDKMGKILWYKLTGSRYGDAATDIAIDSKGNVFIAGYAGYNSMQKRPYDDIALFDDLELQVPKNGLNPHVFDVNFITYLESCSLSDPHTRLISKNTIYAGVGADYYQWYFNNKPISGATDSILEIKSSGNYSVHISLKGCLAQSIDSFYKFEKEVGIESFNNPLNYINVYPVPAQDQVNLKLFTSENLLLQLQLQDLQGRNIAESTYSLQVGENKWSLSLKDVKPGVYFLKLNAKDWQKTEKILIVE